MRHEHYLATTIIKWAENFIFNSTALIILLIVGIINLTATINTAMLQSTI